MRHVVAFGLLRARTWVALAAAFVATYLASGDGKPGWTFIVAVATYSLAGLSIWAHYLEENEPDDAGDDEAAEEPPRPSKHDAWVAESVRRYEERIGRAPPVPAEEPPRKLSRQEREAAEILRRYEEQAEARRAALKQPSGPQ